MDFEDILRQYRDARNFPEEEPEESDELALEQIIELLNKYPELERYWFPNGFQYSELNPNINPSLKNRKNKNKPVAEPESTLEEATIKKSNNIDNSREKEDSITLLGNQNVKYPDEYNPEILETFINKHQENDYFVKFNCPEFTSLCPITGQPDFATITISYVPDVKMVESKSLKLYLFSFRNHGDFHEDCVNIIMKDLIKLLSPKYIEVWGKFLPRGGISIDPYCNYGKKNTKWEQIAFERLAKHDMYPEKVDNR